MDSYKTQILEKECVQFFSRNKNSFETAISLSARLGRTEEQIIMTLDRLVESSFLEIRQTGPHKVFCLKKGGDYIYEDRMDHGKVDLHYIVDNLNSLSKREKEVAMEMINGMDNQGIADKLCISFHTVKNHITKIYEKLEVKDRVQFMKVIYEKKR